MAALLLACLCCLYSSVLARTFHKSVLEWWVLGWDVFFIITVYLLFRELPYCDTRTCLVLGGCNFWAQGIRACLCLCSFCYLRPPLFYLFCHFTSNLSPTNLSSFCCISSNMLFVEHWRGLQVSRPVREIRGNNIFTLHLFHILRGRKTVKKLFSGKWHFRHPRPFFYQSANFFIVRHHILL